MQVKVFVQVGFARQAQGQDASLYVFVFYNMSLNLLHILLSITGREVFNLTTSTCVFSNQKLWKSRSEMS